jgi:hypothetical protein
VQDASSTIVDGIYYGINEMSNSVVAVNPHTLNVTLQIQTPMYTGYVMGGAARIMVTSGHVVVSTRVQAGQSFGWTAAYGRTDGSFVWNVSSVACVGDVPTFSFSTETKTLAFLATNFSTGQYEFVAIDTTTGAVLKSVGLGAGSVQFISELGAAVLFVSQSYDQKYLELLDLKTLSPIWRVASASSAQFLGFQNLISATATYVVVSNNTSIEATSVNLMILSTTSHGELVHVIEDILYPLNSFSTPSLDLVSSPTTALLAFWNGSIRSFRGLTKDGRWAEVWSFDVNVSESSYVVFGADTVATLTITSPEAQSLSIHNFTSHFHVEIPHLKRDNMSSWAQLWVYAANVIMLPYQTDTPTFTAGFVLYNATNGEYLGDTPFQQITYDTLWSNTPTYALEYAPNQYLIDNTGSMYRQTFERTN